MSKLQSSKCVRIPLTTYKKLLEAKANDETYGDAVERLLLMADKVTSEPLRYAVENTIFEDIADARGAAITTAITKGAMPEPPAILAFVGYDNLGEL